MRATCPSPSLAFAVLACLACSEAAPDSEAPLEALSACGSAELTPCDILDSACQARIARIAACQWAGPGTPSLLPEVAVLSAEQYRERLRRAAPAPAEARASRSADTVMALLGLTDSGDLSADALANRDAGATLAFYDFETKSIHLIERGETADLRQADAMLLHELIHAQQDAAHDLSRLQSQAQLSLDGLTAIRGLYEGEAEFHERLFELGLQGSRPSPELLERKLDGQRESAEAALLADSSVLPSSMQLLPYTYGPVWLYDLWLEDGSEAVRALYANPPSNSLTLLQSAWGAPEEAPALLEYPANNVFYRGAPPAADSERIPLGYDRLGPYTVYVAARLAGESASARELALGWRGDQLDVYELRNGAAGRWQLRFDTAAHAQAFSELMAQNPTVTLRQQGVTLVCVVSAGGERPEWLYGPLSAP